MNRLEGVMQDVRFAFRMLRKSPGFAIVTFLTLALGVGANTALFSALEAVVLKPLPYPNASRVMHLFASWPGGFGNMAFPDYEAIRERNRTFEDVAACESWGTVALTGLETPVQLRTMFVTPNYLALLGARTSAGRLFENNENTAEGANPLVILNYAAWQSRFGGDPGIVGRTIELNRAPFTVIGVMSPAFHSLGEVEEPLPDLYLPMSMGSALLGQPHHTDQGYSIYWGLGVLKPGASAQQAQEDLTRIALQLEREQPNTHRSRRFQVQPAVEYANGQLHRPLYLLIGGASLILLIGCVNIANALIARLAMRRREIAVRRAIGGSVPRLAQQLLVECAMLAFAGGGAGVLLAFGFTRALARRIQEHVDPFVVVQTDKFVLAIALALCVGIALFLAVMPAADMRRMKVSEALAQGGRAGMSRAMSTARRALVVAEVSFSIVVLICAGLMLRSFRNLLGSGLGFRTDHLLTFSLALHSEKYATPAARTQFTENFAEKAQALPSVESVSILGPAMLGHATWVTSVYPGEKQPRGPEDFVQTFRHSINPGALGNLGIRVMDGREFTRFDSADAPPVVIISESVAREFWRDANPVGKQLRRPDPTLPLLTVVGVAADARHRQRYSLLDLEYGLPLAGLGSQRDTYFPYAQRANLDVTVAARVRGDATGEASAAIAGVLTSLDRDLPMNDVRLLEDRLSEQNRAPKALGALMSAYAFLALFMAMLGIYSVISQSVSHRTKEMGIRVAFGAQPRDVLGIVLGEGMRLICAGVAIGLAGAWGLTRLMSMMLYGVDARDPATFAAVVPLLAAVALCACWIPARRATHVDPIVALRHD